MESFFFDNGQALLRTLVIGVLAYIAMIFMLRLSGRRTLSKMNAFDLVVTVSLGSTLATVLLSKDVTLAQGCLAFALLIGMQYAVTWTSVRVSWVRRAVTGEPLMLVYQGALLPSALRRARVTEDEIHAAVRAHGLGTLHEVEAIVLETDGSFSVVKSSDTGASSSSLHGVKRMGSQ